MSITAGSPIRRCCDPINISPGHKSLDAELYGLGRTLKHLQPPGGRENGVFDAYRLPPDVSTPRKIVKDYLKSNVFDVESETFCTPRPVTLATKSTQEHVFPATPPKPIPARHNNMKSTLFDPDPPRKVRPAVVIRNPLTGESCKSFTDPVITKARKVRNPITFEGVPEKPLPARCIQPPGGKSSFALEHIE